MSGPPPLIERDAPLDVLQARLDTAAQTGHVMLVAGEAGIGKTRLLRALAARHAAAGGPVWWGACDALDTPHPLAPLLDMARDARPPSAAGAVRGRAGRPARRRAAAAGGGGRRAMGRRRRGATGRSRSHGRPTASRRWPR